MDVQKIVKGDIEKPKLYRLRMPFGSLAYRVVAKRFLAVDTPGYASVAKVQNFCR